MRNWLLGVYMYTPPTHTRRYARPATAPLRRVDTRRHATARRVTCRVRRGLPRGRSRECETKTKSFVIIYGLLYVENAPPLWSSTTEASERLLHV
jgi:hypothetical protein